MIFKWHSQSYCSAFDGKPLFISFGERRRFKRPNNYWPSEWCAKNEESHRIKKILQVDFRLYDFSLSNIKLESAQKAFASEANFHFEQIIFRYKKMSMIARKAWIWISLNCHQHHTKSIFNIQCIHYVYIITNIKHLNNNDNSNVTVYIYI